MNISGIRTCDYSLSKIAGRVAHAQAVLRRLITPRGGLIAAPTYGYDLTNAVGTTVVTSVVAQRVREQCMFDERTESVSVSVELGNDDTLHVSIDLTDRAGPFELVIDSDEQDRFTAQLIIDGNPEYWANL